MWLADLVAAGNDVVEQGEGFVFSLLVDAVVGACQTVELGACGVHFKVVLDDQRERHGIVGNELGGGGFQHLQLALGPFVFTDEISQLGIFVAGFVAERLFFQALVDLTIEQRGLPHLVFIEVDVGEFQLEFGLVLLATDVFDGLREHVDSFFCFVELVG